MVCVVPKVAVALAFATTFPASENPISFGGAFVVGSQQSGALSTGPIVTGGSPGYCAGKDATRTDWAAAYTAITSAKHYSEVTIRRVGGYTPPGSHEVEVHVGLTLQAGVSTSYEFDISFGGTIAQFFRWTMPLGGFDGTGFTTISGGWPGTGLNDGDVVRIEYDRSSGNVLLTVKINTVTVWVLSDSTAGKILTGSPGFGFFADSGATLSSWCIKGYACGVLP